MRTKHLQIPICMLVVSAALAAASGACSDDGASRPNGAAPEAGGFETPVDDAAVTTTPRPDLCTGVTRSGEQVAELELPGEPPPPLGGPVIPGTYELTELNAYVTPPAKGPDAGEDEAPHARLTGRSAQITMVVTATELKIVEARSTGDGSLGGESARAMIYGVRDKSLSVTAVCPSAAAATSLPFSAVGGSLAIFVDPKHREVYTRR
ncbi:MAG: hypothetical protein JWP87_792 [Labilithrix sp.]|nr:hypothetical protein [Labilithrix sp.]